jgi:hypothetical protein
MERQPVSSSNVLSVGYDPDERTTEVEFKGGSVYRYHDVEPHEHEALVNADSIGSHLHKHFIRAGTKHWVERVG